MQYTNIRIWFTLCLSLSLSIAMAQEQLVGLQINPVQAKYMEDHAQTRQRTDTVTPLFLPFFDDFNQSSPMPDTQLWQPSNVFINTSYQYRPANLGVATFDALMADGYLYPDASEFAFPADTLCSLPIRLDSIAQPILRPLTRKDSLYLSFYYQPQGRGDAPEAQDILTLDFYSPVFDLWYEVWSSEGMTMDAFYEQQGSYAQQVLIPITDSVKYYASGFKFRFHNTASLASNSQPDWQSNADMWNIDMVYLNTQRSRLDSTYRKIAFVSPPPSMIKRYWSMPYKQYKNDPTNSMKDSLDILISNLDKIAYIANYSYHISNQTSQLDNYDGGTASIQPFIHYGYIDYPRFSQPPVITFFSIHNQTGQHYKITHTIQDEGQTGVGDTMTFWQEFRDYYAYDDGVPEAGYGFSTGGSKAALQFHLNTKDTLRQIQVYFNPTLTGINEKYFNLMVWKTLEPEDVLLRQKVKAKPEGGLYTFTTYDLEQELILGNDFYIGFEQLTDDNLNIGFDYSQDSKAYLFYMSNEGEWYNSLYEGSLMMRPVLGTAAVGIAEQMATENTPWRLFPNPVQDGILHLEHKDSNQTHHLQLYIYDNMGRVLRQMSWQNTIDVSALPSGMYLMQCIDTNNGQISTQKFVVNGY